MAAHRISEEGSENGHGDWHTPHVPHVDEGDIFDDHFDQFYDEFSAVGGAGAIHMDSSCIDEFMYFENATSIL